METIYQIAGISRQGYYQERARRERKQAYLEIVKKIVKEVRKDHPKMGSRSMHYMLKIDIMGINKYERLISELGLGIKRKNQWIKTTNSNHNYYKYPNLVYGLKITGIDQVWVTDITYWKKSEKVYYLIFIIDVYSRLILAYAVSENLYAINNIKVVKMAFRCRGKKKFPGLIHHSDKGSQYCSTQYIKTLLKADIQISMAENSLENCYAERINGIIKNNYLEFYDTSTLNKTNESLKRIVWLYNNEKPHSELGYLSPAKYESKLNNIPIGERDIMTLYDFKNKK